MIPIVALAAAVLLVDPMAFEQPPLKDGAVMLVVALALLADLARRRRSGPMEEAFFSPLPRPLLGLAGLVGLAALGAAWRVEALPYAREAARWLVFLILARLSMSEAWSRPARIPLALLSFGTIAAAIAALQVAGLDFVFSTEQPVSLFGNTNRTGEFLAPLAVLAFLAAGAVRGRAGALALWLLPLLTAGLILSQSRAALLSAAAGIVLTRSLGPLFLNHAVVRKRFLPPLALALGVAVAAVLAGPGVLRFQAIEDARAGVTSLEYPTNKQRWLLATATLDMIHRAPLLGHGPGRFRAEFPPFRDPEEAAIPTLAGAVSEAEDPHNLYLLLLAEGGAVGLLMFLLFALPALVALRHAGLLDVMDSRRQWAYPLAGAFACALVLALFRSLSTQPPAAVSLFLVGGALLAYRGVPEGTGARRFGRLVALAYVAGIAWVGFSELASHESLAIARRQAERAESTGRLQDLLAADRWLARGQRLQPDNIHLLEVRARILDRLARESPLRAQVAHEVRRQALRYYPFSTTALSYLAAGALEQGDLGRARALLERIPAAFRPDPSDPEAVRAFLLRIGRGEAFGPYLLARVRAGRGSLLDLVREAERARQNVEAARSAPDILRMDREARLAAGCLEAFLSARPFAAEAAMSLADVYVLLGRQAAARHAQHRAHLGFGLDHLRARDYEAARKSASLARTKSDSPEAAALHAVASAALGDLAPLDAYSASAADLDPDFREALRELRSDPRLTSAIDRVAR